MHNPYIHYIQNTCWDVEFNDQNNNRLGFHAFFIAHIPYIPSLMAEEFGPVARGVDRKTLIGQRFSSFINDLAGLSSIATSFELRFIANPDSGAHQATVNLYFIGKVFAPSKLLAQNQIFGLIDRVQGVFPTEDPFAYPLNIYQATEAQQVTRIISPFADISQVRIADVQKFIDRSVLNQNPINDISAFPLPFQSIFDPSGYAKILDILVTRRKRCVLSIAIRPTRLTPDEQKKISQSIARFSNQISGMTGFNNPSAIEHRSRFEPFKIAFEPLIQNLNNLVLLKIQVLQEGDVPSDLLNAVGSVLSNDSKPRWVLATPANMQEFRDAASNFRFLEFKPWVSNQDVMRSSRIPYLSTIPEITGLFCLPVPPLNGRLSGLEIRDEPWTAPPRSENSLSKENSISLGRIVHRGTISNQELRIPIKELRRHMLIAGANGSGKSTTAVSILTQLWEKNLPFLILYPLSKFDYRDLRYSPKLQKDLLIFTVGENIAPLQFNPLYCPTGIPIKQYINTFKEAMSDAFEFEGDSPVPLILHEGLEYVYAKHGWDINATGDENRIYPTFADFCAALPEIVDRNYPGESSRTREIRETIKNSVMIRLKSLANGVFATKKGFPFEILLNKPVIIELAKLGEGAESAIFASLLINRIRAERDSHRRSIDRPHTILIEEAHILMPAASNKSRLTASNANKFDRLLAEIGGFGEAIIVVEQTPTELTRGAISNTNTKIILNLNDKNDWQALSGSLKMNEAQLRDAHNLKQGYGITKDPNGNALKIRSPKESQFGEPPTDLLPSNDELREFMRLRLKELNYVSDSNDHLQTKKKFDVVDPSLSVKLEPIIDSACQNCLVWQRQNTCPMSDVITPMIKADTKKGISAGFVKWSASKQFDENRIQKIMKWVSDVFSKNGENPAPTNLAILSYCLLNNSLDEIKMKNIPAVTSKLQELQTKLAKYL